MRAQAAPTPSINSKLARRAKPTAASAVAEDPATEGLGFLLDVVIASASRRTRRDIRADARSQDGEPLCPLRTVDTI
jgi:hypothetical protein